jgi:secondary thiamine-phosphate synthase enzyme
VRTFEIQTSRSREIVDITPRVRSALGESGVRRGIAVVYVPHTTAGVGVNENADPSVRTDVLLGYENAFPENLPYRHAEGNSTAHIKSLVTGSSATLIVEDGELQLGTWGGVYFCEFDGPRSRRFLVKIMEG